MSSLAELITERLQPALAALLTAFDYTADSGADRWEFAVEMTELLTAGAALADLRWLILRCFAEHAKETTTPGDPHRSFRPLAKTSFPPDTCLVLTPTGADSLRPFVARRGLSPFVKSAEQKGTVPLGSANEVGGPSPEVGTTNSPSPFSGEGRGEGASPSVVARSGTVPFCGVFGTKGDCPLLLSVAPNAAVVVQSPDHATAATSPQSPARSPSRPKWRADLHELHFNGTLVRRYKNPARNQELILAAFEEEGWPARIDDPLPQNGDLDPRQRLRNTIVTLNRHQLAPLLHFRCDGTGCGVQWERRVAAGDYPDFAKSAEQNSGLSPSPRRHCDRS